MPALRPRRYVQHPAPPHPVLWRTMQYYTVCRTSPLQGTQSQVHWHRRSGQRPSSHRSAPLRAYLLPREGECQHLGDERQLVARAEDSHRLASIRRDQALEGWDGAGDLGLGDERHDANLGKAAVVDLSDQALLLVRLRAVLREAKGVEELEGDRVRDATLVERRDCRDDGQSATSQDAVE